MFARLLLFLLLAACARAELKFNQTELQATATAQDKELKFIYPFTNTGTSPVWIVNLTTSCGCTTATADKSEIPPGDSGQITAIYTIGLSEGRHTYTITFQTSEPGTPTYSLKLTADIPTGQPQLTRTPPPLSPRELTWLRQPYAKKTITIDLRQNPGIKITASCDQPGFQISIDITTRPETALIEITPEKTVPRAELTIEFTALNSPVLQQKIPLTVFTRP